MIDLLTAIILLCFPIAVFAATEPLDGVSWGMYGIIMGFSIMCGFASYFSNIDRDSNPFSLMTFIGQIATSGVAGLVAHWLCEWRGFEQPATFAAAGIAGYMGIRFIYFLERIIKNALIQFFEKKLHISLHDEDNHDHH